MLLLINNKLVKVDANWSLRFVEETPVLYYKGKRVTSDWEMVFFHYNKEEPENANTADLDQL